MLIHHRVLYLKWSLLENIITHEEVACGEEEESQEGQRVLKGDGVLHCEEGHPENQRVQTRARRVDAEHDEVAHVFVADAVPGKKAVVIPLENDFLTQFAEVASVQEVVGVHLVRAVRRAHGNPALVGTFSRILDSHYVVPQRVEHQEEENNCVESCGAPGRCLGVWEYRRDEEAEVQNEGDCCGCEEVRRCYSVEESQFQHPGEHICVTVKRTQWA